MGFLAWRGTFWFCLTLASGLYAQHALFQVFALRVGSNAEAALEVGRFFAAMMLAISYIERRITQRRLRDKLR